MGWERKRGKIEEFNRLLRGATDTSFTVAARATLEILPSVRYCITLDSDTRLPRDVARKLIGIIAHPLNRPHFDPRRWAGSRRATAILQPRVSVTMASAAGSLFARLYAGHTGVDPYTTAVSDTYQDLFGEGIFTGKGLYDVDAFTRRPRRPRARERAPVPRPLRGRSTRAPRSSPTSRSSTTIPSSVLAHARRQHRWVRGDWQILRWLFPLVPDARRGLAAQPPAPHLALEDLRQPAAQPGARRRRSPCCFAAWTVLPGSAARLDGGRPRRHARLPRVPARCCGAAARPAPHQPLARVPARDVGGRCGRRWPRSRCSSPSSPTRPGRWRTPSRSPWCA